MKRLLLVFAIWGTWTSCQPDIRVVSCIHEVIRMFIRFMAGNALTQQRQELKSEVISFVTEHLLIQLHVILLRVYACAITRD